MSYIHPSWNYPPHTGLPMDHTMAYDPSMMPPPMMHHMDGYMYPHPPMEMVDYYHQPIMDYDEYTENLSRPRLTKEQVETLEAQFQAHPKPSSNTKRQLAAQTNLSLPRVANWFQNRRAKAKQQKRQEEFEKMQKAKTEAEEAARQKSETLEQMSESRQTSASKEESDQAPTPKPASASIPESKSAMEASPNKQHKKSKSESAREATFLSLQRALNAACAARDRFTGRDSKAKRDAKRDVLQEASQEEEEDSISPTSMAPPRVALRNHESKGHAYQNWPDIKEESASWSHGQTDAYPVTSQAVHEMPNGSHSMQHTVSAYSGAQYHPRTEEWAESSKDQLSVPGMGHDGLSYNNMQYAMSLPTPEISLSRRESSDALANSLNGIGICNADSGLSQSQNRVNGSWKETGRELDLAARRKRPRPAAIGTSNTRSLANSTSMSSLSPTGRMSSVSGNPMRHSKSAQSLNSRYAGVRKASAAQRSPLNFTFAESGSMKASKADMLRPSVSQSTLAPPTPLTPSDFQHFVPASPTESNYCLSAHSTTQFFPSSQPMQVNIASPPDTPLDIYSPFPYHNAAPPMSAPAQVANFPEYVSCEQGPMTARSWQDTNSLSSPDYPSGLQVPHSSTVSPVAYDAGAEHPGNAFGIDHVSGSPTLIYSIEDTDMAGSADANERKATEFMMHEYPGQSMHGGQKLKAYTFASTTTPNNYPP
ncbi:uncharacterized protein N7477_003261 [Penicillium maclennaniae]|uniref:uncharacterized protein n=1 Tax=Penicillium maclennaniae TaxID=1343394 RepID=UPI0025420FF8|nr:uncharacterized protein N7477_003261 [Penicillium maclennaniae]KAJ5677628.1 hypothetical protein N7477_003261 [Penicillium maclennaniae]